MITVAMLSLGTRSICSLRTTLHTMTFIIGQVTLHLILLIPCADAAFLKPWGIKFNYSQPFFIHWDTWLGTRWRGDRKRTVAGKEL